MNTKHTNTPVRTTSSVIYLFFCHSSLSIYLSISLLYYLPLPFHGCGWVGGEGQGEREGNGKKGEYNEAEEPLWDKIGGST